MQIPIRIWICIEWNRKMLEKARYVRHNKCNVIIIEHNDSNIINTDLILYCIYSSQEDHVHAVAVKAGAGSAEEVKEDMADMA